MKKPHIKECSGRKKHLGTKELNNMLSKRIKGFPLKGRTSKEHYRMRSCENTSKIPSQDDSIQVLETSGSSRPMTLVSSDKEKPVRTKFSKTEGARRKTITVEKKEIRKDVSLLDIRNPQFESKRTRGHLYTNGRERVSELNSHGVKE